MRTFEMFRGEDESGVSGTGKVLEGVVFSDGPCVIRWVTELTGRSEARYDSFATFVAIHINSHVSNKTKVVFSDGEIYEQNATKGLEVSVPRLKRRRKAKVPEVAVPEDRAKEVGQSYSHGGIAEVPFPEGKKES